MGGTNDVGTFFCLNPSNSDFDVLRHFAYSTDGGYTSGFPMQATDGNIYSVNSNGSSTATYGTVWKYTLAETTPTFSVIHSFNNTTGSMPIGSLMEGMNGNLIGVTVWGGGGYGVWYEMNTALPIGLVLGSPLDGTLTISGGYHFGQNWEVAGTKCPADPGGVWKLHTGSDFVAAVNDDIFSAESGTVKHVGYQEGWAHYIVIEHTHADGWKYTTVYWHVDSLVAENDTVTKGQHIADVADISGAHLHFGVRIGGYNADVSGLGSLPVENCGSWPSFPNGFISPEDSNYIQFE